MYEMSKATPIAIFLFRHIFIYLSSLLILSVISRAEKPISSAFPFIKYCLRVFLLSANQTLGRRLESAGGNGESPLYPFAPGTTTSSFPKRLFVYPPLDLAALPLGLSFVTISTIRRKCFSHFRLFLVVPATPGQAPFDIHRCWAAHDGP